MCKHVVFIFTSLSYRPIKETHNDAKEEEDNKTEAVGKTEAEENKDDQSGSNPETKPPIEWVHFTLISCYRQNW